MKFKNVSGFTLIELMITVAIIATLAAIVIPSYQNSTIKTYRRTAQGDLLSFAQAFEKYRAVNFTYAGAAIDDENTGVPIATLFSSTSPASGQDLARYDLSIVAANASIYQLRATPIVGSTQEGDVVIDYHSDGRKCLNSDCSGW